MRVDVRRHWEFAGTDQEITHEIYDDKVIRESIYITETWEAPDWCAPRR